MEESESGTGVHAAHVPKFEGGTAKGVQGGYIVIDQTVWRRSLSDDIREIGLFF